MNTLNQLTTLELIIGGFSLLVAVCLEIGYRAIRAAIDKGKPWIITLPGTPGALASLERRHVKEGQVEKKDGDEGRASRLAGQAAYPSNKGPIHILTDYGANLIAPSKDEVAADMKAGRYTLPDGISVKTWADRFLVWDPLLLWRSNRENDMEDLYSSKGEKDPWFVKAFPIVVVLLIAMMGLLAFVMLKVLPIISHANGG